MDYEIYEPYEKLGYTVMSREPSLRWLLNADVRIAFLRCFKIKRSSDREVLGECIKVAELYKPFCPYDFLIVIHAESVAEMSDRQLYALMHHELLHVGVREKDGEPVYSIIPHDVEDFFEILNSYGLHWNDPPKKAEAGD